ncbi:Undecaprenyl-phosphate galactose phosphotransferase [Desulfofarcimen acetoxidans DSM 771]|jgi:lipopolysaccharide/colanic/teichoic acid biosynthesis glycosyltransferase|uniref:Undecaprenyl-phosphate galactose phosphotransferase n=1 Tax=Desulfofarcimen acetoxidans (strain ATCC 49208 / DSM 771 / KCTC 5769 / VKM B-1644 / 5575) TaxID=485916 RepID=C8W2D3_DESAS|nr:sugar transferase [Desulfofarcimen acetoxidans]ACV63617.1 Undecaprenyl-phosphate galactose phosphotransferase [Desulfofarcimen acetoxidans DSM 771]
MSIGARNQAIKRIVDLILAILLIIIFSPIFLGMALLIKFTSPGEIVFKQKRLGLHGQVFWMFKFRSMVKNAVNIGSGMFVEENDSRITPVGKLLRKTSLDELPQLFNVLKGEMSLIGPRPAPLHHFAKYDLRQIERLSVRPGITGWAQVNGRVALYWPERIEMDLWYIKNYSLGLDLKILLMTFISVFRRKGTVAKTDRREKDPFMKE